MKSRKLRALALALSAIMTITAVPSTLFAEDFFVGAAEEDGWDSEIVADVEAPAVEDEFDLGFGSEAVEEAVVEAPAVEEFDFFAADELVSAEDGIESEAWNADNKTVTITFKSAELKPATYGVADGLQVIQVATDCTRSFMKATVKDEKGNAIEIFSNIPTSSRAVTLVYGGADAKNVVKTDAKPRVEDTGVECDGTFPNGNTHTWDGGKRFDEKYGCVEDEFKTEYTCTVCGTKGYRANSQAPISADTKSEAAVPETAKGSGHKKPADPKAITTVTIYESSKIPTSDQAVYLDAKTGAEIKKEDIKAENCKVDSSGNPTLDSAKEPVAATAGKDVYWFVCTSYECANNCGTMIYEIEQKSKIVRNVVYALKADSNVTCDLTEATEDPATQDLTKLATLGYTKFYAGSGDYAADSKHFSITNCYDSKGIETTGKFDELWYTSETLAQPQLITAKYEHVIKAHEKTKTVFLKKAVTLGKQGNNIPVSTDATIADVCRVSLKDGEIVSVDGSKSCEDVKYYVAVVCDGVNDKGLTVLSCTEATAAGDPEAHKYNTDISELIYEQKDVPVGAVTVTDVKKVIDVSKKEIVTGTVQNGTSTVTKQFASISDLIDQYKNKTSIAFKNATYTCTENGTVDVYYTCAVCGKEVSLGTFKVTAPGHNWAWVDIEPKQDATCTADGFVTQQSQCTVCSAINPDLAVRKAITQKLNHKGIENVKVYYMSVADGGEIVGPQSANTALKDQGDGTGNQSYNNKNVVKARVYKLCPICGKPVYKDPEKADAKDNWGVTPTVTVKSVNVKNFRCNNGTITVEATAKDPENKDIVATGTYDYWKDVNAYQARTAHTAVAKADGSVVCAVCGDVLAEAPVVTTEPTTETTTEAKPETTTVAPQAETTTVAPQPETTTVAPQPETTTVAPQPETTTVAPQPETTTVEPVSETTTEAPATMPAQVTGEKITKNSPTKGIIGVKYNAVEGADSYTVNVREPNGTWTKNPTDGAETAYNITGLTEGKLYDIRIAAVGAGIAGPRSAHLYRWLKKVTLDKPKKVKGEAGAVTVTWTAADGASKYKLYYSTDKAFKTDVKSVKVTENTAKVTGLKTGTRYYFKVRCYSKGADKKTYTGGWSNVRSKILK